MPPLLPSTVQTSLAIWYTIDTLEVSAGKMGNPALIIVSPEPDLDKENEVV